MKFLLSVIGLLFIIRIDASHYIYENKATQPIRFVVANKLGDTLFYAENILQYGTFSIYTPEPDEVNFFVNDVFIYSVMNLTDTVYLTIDASDIQLKFDAHNTARKYEEDWRKVRNYRLKFSNEIKKAILLDKENWTSKGFNIDTLKEKMYVMSSLLQDVYWHHYLSYPYNYVGLIEMYYTLTMSPDTVNYSKFRRYIANVPKEYQQYSHYKVSKELLTNPTRKFVIGDKIDSIKVLDINAKNISLREITDGKETYFLLWNLACHSSLGYPPDSFAFLKSKKINLAYLNIYQLNNSSFKEYAQKYNYTINSYQINQADYPLTEYKINSNSCPDGFLMDKNGKLVANNLPPSELKKRLKIE